MTTIEVLLAISLVVNAYLAWELNKTFNIMIDILMDDYRDKEDVIDG